MRRLAAPLKTLLLDARSAVVKEATELIGLLMSVKLQCHPSFLTVEEEAEDNEDDGNDTNNDADKEIDDIFNNTNTTTTPTKQSTKNSPPPPKR